MANLIVGVACQLAASKVVWQGHASHYALVVRGALLPCG
eukprot:CAMPEP_0203961706 /NCGR_PEP_ID=MMETSP0359-20131031/92081_1 /ASSEMBLY_ACC=CAM_ASM_000338 /TAXON_ID=268821 /ORGANISM="Scrippsiella Hangoei, Strain SHTV-5" /LENGTH=38 /DNA_ID= /DNA_START= /DNA_END= /DNA_ORIENTATION=